MTVFAVETALADELAPAHSTRVGDGMRENDVEVKVKPMLQG